MPTLACCHSRRRRKRHERAIKELRAVLGTALTGGDVMSKMVITHGVVDVDNWLKFKTERAEFIAMMGGTNVVDHVAPDGSNKVAVAADVEDVEEVLAAIASPSAELADGMQRHGVIPPLAMYIEK